MDIIGRLRKEKKSGSVFDSLIKKKEEKEVIPTKPSDVEVTQLTPDKAPPAAGPKSAEPKDRQSKREFRTEGMHEFDIDSLGASVGMSTKLEYKARISVAIDENKFDEAVELIKELKEKLTKA